MPAATMFSKFKSGPATPQNPIDGNPISQHFEIGKQTACAGPELVWRIHDGYKKSDGRVSRTKVLTFLRKKTFFFDCLIIFFFFLFFFCPKVLTIAMKSGFYFVQMMQKHSVDT